MTGVIHNSAGDADGLSMVSQVGYGAHVISVSVHDHGVQGSVAGGVCVYVIGVGVCVFTSAFLCVCYECVSKRAICI